MTVKTPFSAPAWPPETGASTNSKPSLVAAASRSRATSADAVVWSTKVAPFFVPANAPSAPSVIARRSLSLPTQAMTKSWPSAAAFGVAAVLPPNFSAHVLALAAVRLNTVTSWPPFFTRCPAMGKPITPRPRKATLAMCGTLSVVWVLRVLAGRGAPATRRQVPPWRRNGAHHKPLGGEGNGFVWPPPVLGSRDKDFKTRERKHGRGFGRERWRPRSFQHPDPESGRDGPLLRGRAGPGKRCPAELRLPGGLDVQRGQAGGAPRRYFADLRAAKAGFRRRPPR